MAADGFFRGHQVSRVLGVAVPLVLFLLWWGLWGARGDEISVTEVTAVVLRDDGRTCLVRVESGQEVRIIKPRNVATGMRLRMRRTEYDDGELRFEVIGRASAQQPDPREPQVDEG